MKDILKFGQYVRQIAEAHNSHNTKREKALAEIAEQHFFAYGTPDYSARAGEAVEEPSFWEDLAAAERTGKDCKNILLLNLQDAHNIKEQAEQYLMTTNGEKAPGRCYMRCCLNATEGIIEYLESLLQTPRFALPIEQDAVMNEERKDEIVCFELPPREEKRESLFRQTEIKADIKFADFKNYIEQLTQNGILCQGKDDSVRKLQAGFKSFLIGADEKDVAEFGSKDNLIVGNTNKFVLLIDKLQSKITVDARKNRFWSIVGQWFVYKKGETTRKFKQNSLRASCSRARKKLDSKDESIDNLVNSLLRIIYKEV